MEGETTGLPGEIPKSHPSGHPKRPKRSWGRKLFRLLMLGLCLSAITLVAAPWILSTSAARSFVVSTVNRSIAPSRVAIRSLSVSWFGPVALDGLSLKNGDGKTLIEAKKAVLSRGLLALARSPMDLGVLTVTDANVDIERKGDGSIDLVNALMPPSTAGPAPNEANASKSSNKKVDLTLNVKSGTLKLTTPELAEPLMADSLEMSVRVPSAPNAPLTWKIRLAKPKSGQGDETLGIDGSYDYQNTSNPGLELTIHGERWPFSAIMAGLAAGGKLDGAIEYDQKGGALKTVGKAQILDLVATGSALSSDIVHLETVGGSWDLGQAAQGWTIRHLDLKAPVANLEGTGEIVNGAELPNIRVSGSVDLAALSKQIPKTLRLKDGLTLEKGSASLNLDLKSDQGVQTATLDAGISELTAKNGDKTFTLKDNATVNVKGDRKPDGFSVETLRIKTAFLDVSAQGNLAKGLTLSGHLDLGAVQSQFRDLIDFNGVELAGKGRMAGDYRKSGDTFIGRYATEIKGLKLAGLTAEPIVRDDVRFDAAANGPIDPSGLPVSVDVTKINLKSAQDNITITAQFRPEATSLNAVASFPWKVLTRDGQVDLKVVGKYRGPAHAIDFDQLKVGLKPLDPALKGEGTIAFAAQGTLDLGADDIMLKPLPGADGNTLTIAPEGMKIHGLWKTPTNQRAARIVVDGDLGAIDHALHVWNGSDLYGIGGAFHAMIGMGPGDPGIIHLGGDLDCPNLILAGNPGQPNTEEGPLAIAYRTAYLLDADRLDFSKLIVAVRYGKVEAEGSLGEPTGRRVFNMKGTLSPNWEVMNQILRNSVEPNATLAGEPRSFRLQGLLNGGSLPAILNTFQGELGINLRSADAFGMRLGPAPVVVHFDQGNSTVDEIVTTLNGGKVDLKPGLTIDEKNGVALTIYSGTKIEGAAINDEVSRRVLRYVAPVLDKATHVTGKVNLDIENGDIPITGPPSRTMTLTGQLAFQDVNFAPGPFATQVLSVVGKGNTPGLKLTEPINLSIANSRVIQKGLEIPINGGSSIDLAGSVGFDETLDLRASLPLTKAMLGQLGGLDNFVNGEKITIPIGGTVSKPNINRQALQVALKGLLKNGLSKEAGGFLNKLGIPNEAGQDGTSTGTKRNGNSGDPLKSLEGELMKRLGPKR